MAELVGVVAAAGQFLEQGFRVIQLVKRLKDQVQNAPTKIQEESEKLRETDDLAAKIKATKSLQINEVEKIVKRSALYTSELATILANLLPQPDANIGERTWKAVGGLAQEAAIHKLFSKLEIEKNSLQSLMHIVSIQQNAEGFSSVNTKLESLKIAIDPSPEEQKCLRDLFVTDPVSDREGLITAKGEIVPGTCEWVETHVKYQSWLRSERGLLWISGGPGKGKTMLSIHLSKRLEEATRQLENLGQKCLVTYFFCDNKQQTRNTATSVLRGLLYLMLKQDASLMSPLLETWKIQDQRLFEESAFESLWGVFTRIIQASSMSTLYAVIDGLDECDQKSLQLLLKKFRQLYRSPSPVGKVKLLVISREYPDDLLGLLHIFPHIRLDPDSTEEVNNGIRLYISTKVNELAEMPHKNYSQELRQLVKRALLDRADGTYLWVSFVIQDLEAKSASEVEECIEDLPRGLDEIYERMLIQIPPKHRVITRKILLWLLFAKRALFIEELAYAIGAEASRTMKLSDIMRDYIRQCGHFANLADYKVTLVHQSAKDFLIQRRPDPRAALYFDVIDLEQAQAELAVSCLTHIQLALQSECAAIIDLEDLKSSQNFSFSELSDRYPFVNYASIFWSVHSRECGQGGVNLIEKNPEFFANESRIREKLTYIYSVTTTLRSDWYMLLRSYKGHCPLMHFACLSGLVPWIEKLLPNGDGKNQALRRRSILDQQDEFSGRTPLIAAILANHLPVVRVLVQHGATVNFVDGIGRTPLSEAVHYKRSEIVRFLLEHHADPNTRLSHIPIIVEGTALHMACMNGDFECVELLVNSGAVFLHNDGDTRLSGLQCAIRGRETRILRLLLKNLFFQGIEGPLCNAKDKYQVISIACHSYQADLLMRWLVEELHWDPRQADCHGNTMLHLAASEGHTATLQYLIEEQHLNPNETNNYGKTALHKVTKRGIELARYLIEEQKIDPNTRDMSGRTVLHDCAARYPDMKLVRYLIDELRMNPLQMDNNGMTMLHHAVRKKFGGAYIVRYLIENQKMEPCQADNNGDTALHHAAKCMNLELMDYLLGESRMDPNKENKHGDTALFSAMDGSMSSKGGQAKLVEFIEEYPLDPSYRNSSGETALHRAAQNGLLQILQLLIAKYHLSPQVTKDNGDTPLHVAVYHSRLEVITYLLDECGVDVDIRGPSERTSLHLLVDIGSGLVWNMHRKRIVQVLLDHGANINLPDSSGLTVKDYVLRNGDLYDIMKHSEKRSRSVSQEAESRSKHWRVKGRAFMGELTKKLKLEGPNAVASYN